jgi:hypothetical protein
MFELCQEPLFTWQDFRRLQNEATFFSFSQSHYNNDRWTANVEFYKNFMQEKKKKKKMNRKFMQKSCLLFVDRLSHGTNEINP